MKYFFTLFIAWYVIILGGCKKKDQPATNNAATATWERIGVDIDGATQRTYTVFNLAFDNAGNLYAASFLEDAIYKWDGTKWTSISMGPDYQVIDIGIDSKGNLYNAFRFVANHDTVNSYMAKWDGNKWQYLGHDSLYSDYSIAPSQSLAIDANDNVFLGLYKIDHNTASVSYTVVRWDGVAWMLMPLPVSADEDLFLVNDYQKNVYAVAVSSQNNIVYKWNGNTWEEVSEMPASKGKFVKVAISTIGKMYAVLSVSNAQSPTDIYVNTGTEWRSINMPSTNIIPAIYADASGDLYMSQSLGNGGIQIQKWDGVKWNVICKPELLSDIMSLTKRDGYIYNSTSGGNTAQIYRLRE